MGAYAEQAAVRARKRAIRRLLLLAVPGALGWIVCCAPLLFQGDDLKGETVVPAALFGWFVGALLVSVPLAFYGIGCIGLALVPLWKHRTALNVRGALLVAATNGSFALFVLATEKGRQLAYFFL